MVAGLQTKALSVLVGCWCLLGRERDWPLPGSLLAVAADAAAAEGSEVYGLPPALPAELSLEEVEEAVKEADVLSPARSDWPLLAPPPEEGATEKADGLLSLQSSGLDSRSLRREVVLPPIPEEEPEPEPEPVVLPERGELLSSPPSPLAAAQEPSQVRPPPTIPARKTDLLALRRRTRGNTDRLEELSASATAETEEDMLPPYKGSEELFVGGLLLAGSGFLQMQGFRSQAGFFVVLVFAALGFLSAALGIFSQITSRNRRRKWIQKQGSLLDHLRN